MKLTLDEIIRSEDTSPLRLFAQGIRSEKTREKYTRTLRKVMCEFLEDVLEGDFEQRVTEFVKRGRDDPDWMRDLLISLSWKLRQRTELPKDHPDYLNPVSFGNYFKPLKKLADMNDVALTWKRVYATYPELDNIGDSRGWSREEIAQMLLQAHDPMDRALVLVLASSGIRAGGLDLDWRDLIPIYRVDGRLAVDPGEGDREIACAALTIYRGSPERYLTFVTPEAYHAISSYGRAWAEWMGHQPGPKDPIFLARKRLKRASEQSVEKRIRRMATQAGLRDSGGGPTRRYNVPLMNGFRRFWNKTCKEALSEDSRLASLIRKEFMMGHRGLVSLDKNYFKTDMLELAAEYVTAVPDLTIDDADRLRRSNRRMADNIRKMENEKDVRIAQLEEKVREMEQMRLDAKGQLEKIREEIRISNERDMRRLMQEYRDATAKEPPKGDGRPRTGQQQA